MDWLLLTLLSAFSLATADALTKRYLSDYRATELVLVRFLGPAVLLAPLLLVDPPVPLAPAFWGWMAALVPLEVLAMLLYVRALRDAPLSLTLPYLAFTPVFTTLSGWVLLGERVSAQGLGGILLVVLGTYLLNLERPWHRQGRALLAPFAAALRERAARLMLLVAALYSLTSVLGKGALGYMPAERFGAFYFAVLGLVTAAVFSIHNPAAIRVLWRRPGPHLLVGLAMAVMVVAHFAAIARVEVAYMIAIKRSSLLFGMLYGALWFGEKGLAGHLFAGACMLAGMALIAT